MSFKEKENEIIGIKMKLEKVIGFIWN